MSDTFTDPPSAGPPIPAALTGQATVAPTPSAAPPSDQTDRDRIRADLETTLFVEAGAGAGKTTALAGRIVGLVGSGVAVGSIAAITFTEKAAAELRHRTRDLLAEASVAANTTVDGRERAERCRMALGELEAAPIGTLHAFAARLLREFPVEAGLPPNFTVLDEVGSDLAFEERWSSQLLAMVDDPDLARLVQYARLDRVTLKGMRRIARSFGDSWDLVARRVDLTRRPPDPPPFGDLIARIERLVATTDPPDGDTVGPWLAEAGAFAEALRRPTSEFAVFEIGDKTITSTRTVGNQANWKHAVGGAAALFEFRAERDAIRADWEGLRDRTRTAWQQALGAEIGRFTLQRAAERRRDGALEFHDLLVIARELIAGHPHVRADLHRRYQRLLIDEFQDTDPLQLDIAVRIASDPASADAERWDEMAPVPGRLFFVGDPKQSIYRFRRADIAQYLAAATGVGAAQLALTTNFRSTAAVLDWVNHTFAELIVEEPGSQPGYRSLDLHRRDHPGSATVLGAEAHADGPAADELRHREAIDIATIIRRALDDGWVVGSGAEARRCRLSDIAILLPSRLSLASLTEALRDERIAFQAENSSVVYATAEIRQLMLTLRALDDPTDALALVSVLRSPLFGCSDRDLYRWYAAGGRWRADLPVQVSGPGIDDNPVLVAMGVLRGWSQARFWHTPSELLGRIVTERRVLELALADPGARDTWRRVRFVIDQARAWAEAGGVGLRSYLAWTRRQGEDGRYVAEAILPETDIDAVRIMTIHAAKGLEFPITIVGGMTAKRGGMPSHSVVWTRDSWTLRSGADYEAFQPLDEQLDDHERLRLLYVACTRARDHLVVSLHRKATAKTPASPTAAERLAPAALAAPAPPPGRAATGNAAPSGAVAAELPWGDEFEWAAERQRAVVTASRPSTLSPSRLVAVVSGEYASDPALEKDPVDLELPAWQRGRYGTSVGRAVHAVLQSVDFDGADNLDALATAQAAAEGLPDRVRLIAAFARSAIAAPIVRLAAAGAPHWRELFVAAPIGGTLVEGYIDLLVRTDDGLVVVDYKTDHIADEQALDDRVGRYRTQLAAYGLALESILGEPVSGAHLVFCRPGGAIELPVPGWAEALADLRRRLETGQAPPMSDDASPDSD